MPNPTRKTYTLGGLGCAHCAEKIQDGLSRLDADTRFTLNFSTGTLIVEAARPEVLPDLMQEAQALITRIEPGVLLTPQEQEALPDPPELPIFELRLAASLLVFAAALLAASEGNLRTLLLLAAYGTAGYDVLWRALRNVAQGHMLDEHFLMAIATVGALGIGEPAEAAAVMIFYQVGELFQGIAVRRSRRSIKALLSLKVDTVTVLENGIERQLPTESVPAGTEVVVRPGERLALDGLVTSGFSTVDTSPLTGESVPREVGPDAEVLSGMINLTGRLTLRTLRPYSQGAVARILHLVEEAASAKAPTEQFITRFARVYTPLVVGAAGALAVLPPLLFGLDTWSVWLYRALIFLVISCPCALVISIPLGFFGGIGAASRAGILVKGSNFLEALTHVDTVVFDKTGTLTEGRFTLQTLEPAKGYHEEQLLELAAAAESASTHPIARSIMSAWNRPVDASRIQDIQEVHGQGIVARWEGAPLLAGRKKLLTDRGILFPDEADSATTVYVALDGHYVGRLRLKDQLKPGTDAALDALRKAGIHRIALLTGDAEATARAIASEAGIDTVHAELLPEDKVKKLEALMTTMPPKKKLIFVGDGINDAPVLARADIGIAMGGLGSDAAVEAADIVLMTDEPAKVAEAIHIARFTRKIVVQNIILAFAVKGIVLLLGAGGLATLWEAIFADVGVAVLAILNAMRVIKGGERREAER